MKGRLHQKVCLLKGRMVYVRNHQYLGESYPHGLSNWVTFSEVGADGMVARATAGDYDMNQFTPLVKQVEVAVRDWNGVGDPA